MTPAERAEARRRLRRAWGDRVDITTDADGCLIIDINHPCGGGHTKAQISTLRSYVLSKLTAERPAP